MTEWPVELSKHHGTEDGKPVAPGNTIYVIPTAKDGERHSYILLCPRCGQLGDCPVATPEKPANSEGSGRVWAATVADGKLTMDPSILCECDAHFWLTDGVLREV